MDEITIKLTSFLEKNDFKELLYSDIMNLIDINIVSENIKNNIEKGYQKNLIFRNNLYDIFIFNWTPMSKTKIHNHAKNGCIMKILDGELTNTIYNKNLEKINENSMIKNDVNFISDDIGYHSISNVNYNSMSIHIYSPPNHVTKYY